MELAPNGPPLDPEFQLVFLEITIKLSFPTGKFHYFVLFFLFYYFVNKIFFIILKSSSGDL